MWKYLNKLNSKTAPVPPNNLTYNDQTVTSLQDIVDTFSQYFSTVHKNYEDSEGDYNPTPLDSKIKDKLKNVSSFIFDYITEHDVYKTFEKLNVNKAIG